MKKKFYFATLVIALLTFTGCANDEYVGDQQNLGDQNGAIAFSTKSENTVRGELRDDAAAKKLNYQFWVYGWKEKISTVEGGNTHIDESALVFNNYVVKYPDATSTSNTNRWEYVGKGNDGSQTIKYWDYSFDQYEFEAYSYNTGKGSVTRITEYQDQTKLEKGDYKVTEAPDNLYFAEKKTVEQNKYQNAVELKFKSVLSKIRVGFYETIPGYSVKINAFYPPNNTTSTDANDFVDAGTRNTRQFVAWCPNKEVNIDHPFAVSYDTDGNPAVTKVAETTNPYYAIDGSVDEYKLDAKLTLGTNLLTQGKIGETYSAVTWDQLEVNNGPSKYTYFIPQIQLWDANSNESQVKPMKIKVDYTLKSEDSNEEINVTGATAIVPADYVRWAPNKAYSYVFKISDQTNGTTGTEGTDPAGLYPITFDAVVEDMSESTDYLTTVSDLSITATQETQFAEADKAVFKTGEVIKVKVMQGGYEDQEGTKVLKTYDRTGNFVKGASNDKFEAKFVTTYNSNTSLDSYLTGENLQKYYDGGYIPLIQQRSAGYWIVRVTYNDNGTNITKYAVLKVG